MLNRDTFFAYARKAPFGGRLTEAQVEGTAAILDAWEELAAPADHLKQLAYVLATAFHETGGKMQPVREGFAKSDSAARKILSGRAYVKADPKTGHSYYGRGLVQLTWSTNYRRVGERLGVDLYRNPDLALDLKMSAKILVIGMIEGIFTGKRLTDYFSGGIADSVAARRIINGTDKKDLIAGYYNQFLGALDAADEKTPQPADVKPEDAKPDSPALATDKTTMGALTGLVGAGGAGILAAIDNPWAFGALVVVALGVLLFLSGRLEIRRKAGA